MLMQLVSRAYSFHEKNKVSSDGSGCHSARIILISVVRSIGRRKIGWGDCLATSRERRRQEFKTESKKG